MNKIVLFVEWLSINNPILNWPGAAIAKWRSCHYVGEGETPPGIRPAWRPWPSGGRLKPWKAILTIFLCFVGKLEGRFESLPKALRRIWKVVGHRTRAPNCQMSQGGNSSLQFWSPGDKQSISTTGGPVPFPQVTAQAHQWASSRVCLPFCWRGLEGLHVRLHGLTKGLRSSSAGRHHQSSPPALRLSLAQLCPPHLPRKNVT